MVIERHIDLTVNQLLDISELKHKAWPQYSVIEHGNWILQNYSNSDLHVMEYLDKLVAYISLKEIEVQINGETDCIKATCCLCSEGFGHGFLLKKKVLSLAGRTLGFCKPHLIKYYQGMGCQVAKDVYMPNVDLTNYIPITYNIKGKLTYLGKRL